MRHRELNCLAKKISGVITMPSFFSLALPCLLCAMCNDARKRFCLRLELCARIQTVQFTRMWPYYTRSVIIVIKCARKL